MLLSLVLYARAGLVVPRRPISDFYAAGRLVPAPLNGAAIAVCFVVLIALTGFARAAARDWDAAFLLVLGAGGGLLLLAFLLAPQLRKFGGFSIGDFLGERFAGRSVRPLAVAAVCLCSFPALAVALIALGALAETIFAVDPGTGVGLGMIMLLLCCLIGGLRSANLTQLLQYAVLLTVSVLALLFLIPQQGASMDAGTLGKVFAGEGVADFAGMDWVNRLGLFFCLLAGTASLPSIVQQNAVAPAPETARASFLWSLPLAAALALAAQPYAALVTGQGGSAGPVAFGLIMVGATAGCLAAGSGLLLAIANALSDDLYFRSVHLRATTGQRLLVARMAVVVVAGLVAWAAIALPKTMLAASGGAFSLAASAFFPALVLGVWWKRATAEGALAGMLAGLAVCLFYMLAPRYIPFAFYETSSFLSNATPDEAARYGALRQGYYLADEGARAAALAAWEETARAVANWGGIKKDFAALFAVPIGFLVMVGVSLFTPAPSRDVQSFVEDLRKPSVA